MRLLTINTGSSGLKASLYDVDEIERLILSAQIERIGQAGSRLHIEDARATPLDAGQVDIGNHRAAVETLLGWLQQLGIDAAIEHCTRGASVWAWAGNDQGVEPDMVLTSAGDIPTQETLAAAQWLQQRVPERVKRCAW